MPNVLGTTPPGWLGVAAVAGPVDGVPPKTPNAGTVGVAGALDAGPFRVPKIGWDDAARGVTVGASRRIGPPEARPVPGALAPPSSRFWSLVEFIRAARSLM
jgi:hypothetical protein